MPRTVVDILIVGQGLAGSTLAWQIRGRGRSLMVIDDADPTTASRIAAGLVTPITGQRLVPSWRFGEFWPAALEFYRRVEKETGREFFREIPMVRLFKTAAERQRMEKCQPGENLVQVRPDPVLQETCFQNALGGFEMTGGQLDVPAFLESSRIAFEAQGQYRKASLKFPEDLEIRPDGVRLPKFDLEAKQVVFCQGFAGRDNPWFREVPFDPAKGEILTVRVPGLAEERVIHRGIWLTPCGEELFRAGATYDRDHLDAQPTDIGREQIFLQLRAFLKLSFEVVDHAAAVRPIVVGRHPVIGLHPRHPQLGYFNGLASKGTLQAPRIARQFADFLLANGKLETILDLQNRFGKRFSTGS